MPVRIPTLPELTWTHAPGVAEFEESSSELTLRAGPGVDWSNDALGGPPNHTATALSFRAPEADFTLSARVRVDGERTTFDAAVLALWSDDDHWAKLCFEFSPQATAMVVTVITDRFSDDCNSAVIVGSSVHLRIGRIGDAWAFHSSADGERWDFVRLFRLPAGTGPWMVGFMSQAPLGENCVGRFDRIGYSLHRLTDLRGGQ